MKETMKNALFLMQDIRGGGAELVTLNVVSGIIAVGGEARIHAFSEKRADHALPKNLARVGKSVFAAHGGRAVSLWRALCDAGVIVGSLEIKTHLAAVLFGAIFRKPVVLWLHKDLRVFLANKGTPQRVIYKALFGLNLRFSQQTIAVSEGVAQGLRTMFPRHASRIVCIHNPIDFAHIDSHMADALVAAPWMKKPFVLSVGRLTSQKGFDLLIQAFALVSERVSDVDLVILGQGEERDALERLASELGIADRVHLPGFISPHHAMARASLFATSSRFEGLPLVLIEALYQGARIVSTDCPSGPREVLDGGRHGALIANGAVTDLADAMVRELTTADADGAKASRRARAKDFSFDCILSEWERLLGSV
ncbi:glycosyltransferase [Paraburkholderia sp. HD33-4]|uniref:glycosyltransferase n=1 Tax=Paraburkholderia sp. HD33-4 TaxID=2883242 RepID=UPI001F37E195|nr:glycosyltransferase [Paraburkholderia sp. HD33-4]